MKDTEIRFKLTAIAVSALFGGFSGPMPLFYGSWIAHQITKAERARP